MVLCIHEPRDMVAALKAHGSPVRYTEYAEVAHAAWVPAGKSKDRMAWQFA
jgi:hypothetical protein